MFEDCLVESRAQAISASKRWIAVFSLSLQLAIACVAIVIPLLHPERLTFHIDTPKVTLPLLHRPPQHIETAFDKNSSVSAGSQPLATPTNNRPLFHVEDPAPSFEQTNLSTMSASAPITNAMPPSSNPTVSLAQPKHPPVPLRISTGVAQGMLLAPIRPVYPQIAKAAHVQGDVIVNAVISRTGSVEQLDVVSGPPMLRQAAMEAIRAARYQPYRLNGEPTEAQITITVNFRIGG